MTTETSTPTAPGIACDLVHQLFVLFKTATVYDIHNEGFQKPAHHARSILKAVQEEYGQLALEVRNGYLFFILHCKCYQCIKSINNLSPVFKDLFSIG